MSVVLPDDSGPKISTMRPRGKPPTPSARSSDRAPDGMAATLTAASSSPMRMIEPLPNWRSIWVNALFSAESRAFAAFSVSESIISGAPRSLRDEHQGTGRIGRHLHPFAPLWQRVCNNPVTGRGRSSAVAVSINALARADDDELL